ncbi:MAG: VWA domain-containing protein [Planctomycetaceae bacterium]
MTIRILCLTGTLLFATAINAAEFASPKVSAAAKATVPAQKKSPPRIQLAILLDTSNSMDGLINQARTQLWKIVNELATTRRDGMIPHLEVALYEYGNDSISAEKLHVRKAASFTQDLDRVSEVLYALTTNGGQEYCGAVIEKSLAGLDWNDCDADLQMIVIAGNEPFSQGPVDYHESCRAAINHGITITTIFCGSEHDGINTGWKDGALLAEGSYLWIDQNEPAATIPTPFDDKLSTLSIQINSTFLFYGNQKDARENAARQEAQDTNAAAAAPAAAAERAAFKSSAQYQRASRDLIDALASGTVTLEALDPEDLPADLRSLSRDEQQKIILSKTAERQRIRDEIQELTQQRQKFLDDALKTTGDESRNTLDAALLQAVREQATRKQFTLPSGK